MGKRLIPLLLILSVFLVSPALAKTMDQLEIPIYQCQLQCRHWRPPLQWSYWYQNYETTLELRRTGNALHLVMSYQPAVTQEEGTSMVFTKRGSRWVLHEGTIKYVSPYSGLWITEYWRGYLQFDGQPSVTSQLHGVMYQWGYAFGVDEPTVKSFYTNAVWDAVMEAWLLGFSVYLWDDRSAPQNYIGASGPILPTYGFPDPFIEPVPASNCNPMSL